MQKLRVENDGTHRANLSSLAQARQATSGYWAPGQRSDECGDARSGTVSAAAAAAAAAMASSPAEGGADTERETLRACDPRAMASEPTSTHGVGGALASHGSKVRESFHDGDL